MAAINATLENGPVRPRAPARATLGGAVAIGETLPEPLAAALLTTARDSFTEALVLTAAISAALMIVTAVVAAVALRRTRPPSESGAPTSRS
jgi:DHA2 family multidrug resistance protein-like MFS transporter